MHFECADIEKVGRLLASYDNEADVVTCFEKDTLVRACLSDSDALGKVLGYLNPLKIKCLLRALQQQTDFYPVKQSLDVLFIFRGLSFEQRAAAYEVIAPMLPDLVRQMSDFYAVFSRLSVGQSVEVYEKLKTNLYGFIGSAGEFVSVCRFLPPTQRTEVYEALKSRLPRFIENKEDFFRVLLVLSPEQCDALCAALRPILPNLIKTFDDLADMRFDLSCEQYSVVCVALKAGLPNLVKSIDDVISIFRFLQRERCAEVYEALKPRLIDLIKSVEDFSRITNYLLPTTYPGAFKAMAEACLPNLVKDKKDFLVLLRCLSPMHYETVRDVLRPIKLSFQRDLQSLLVTDKRTLSNAAFMASLESYRCKGAGGAVCCFWATPRERKNRREVGASLREGHGAGL